MYTAFLCSDELDGTEILFSHMNDYEWDEIVYANTVCMNSMHKLPAYYNPVPHRHRKHDLQVISQPSHKIADFTALL